jgi:hypothetical protein
MASGIDQPPDSLHRSKPVYKCDDLRHSAIAGTSLPLQACSHQSFTEQPVVWASTKTAYSLTQRDSCHFRTSHQADFSAKKRINAHLTRRRCQPTPPMAMQDMCRSSEYQNQSEFENRAQAEFALKSAEWLGTSLDLHNHSQQYVHVPSDAHLFYHDDPSHLESPSQGQMPGQVSRMWWDVSKTSSDYQPDHPDLRGDVNKQGLVDSNFVPSRPNLNSEPYAFPLTPPSSTRSEGASPTGGTACNDENAVHNAPNTSSGPSASLSLGSSIPATELSMSPASQSLFPDLIWSDEEFARLLQTDALAADLNSGDYGCAGKPSFNSVWNHQTQISSQHTNQLYSHSQQDLWSSPVINQLDYLDNYPSISPDALDSASPLVNLASTASHHYFDATQPSVQPAQPVAFVATPSSVGDLRTDVDLAPAGRRGSVKSQQRAAAKDRELIEWKKQGLSYKEIKARGRFEEAESTLRGRYRTLTKPKHLRVRKPKWQQQDVGMMPHTWQGTADIAQVQILLEAVDRHFQNHIDAPNAPEQYSTEAQKKAAKVPWKQVAEYMEERGCFRYGNATVKKKYIQVMETPLDF